MKICRDTPDFLKMGHTFRALYVNTWVPLIVAGDMNPTFKHLLFNTHYFYVVDRQIYLGNTHRGPE